MNFILKKWLLWHEISPIKLDFTSFLFHSLYIKTPNSYFSLSLHFFQYCVHTKEIYIVILFVNCVTLLRRKRRWSFQTMRSRTILLRVRGRRKKPFNKKKEKNFRWWNMKWQKCAHVVVRPPTWLYLPQNT